MFPAEAMAQELKRRGRRVLLVTDERGDRYAGSFPCDEKFLIAAGSPNVGGPVRKALAAAAIAGGLIKSLQEFRRRGVDIAVGFGGYPSLPSMKAAELLKIPFGVHEQNAVLGRSNRLLARGASFLAHAFPELDRAPAGVKARVEVGNPVRDAVAALAGAPYPAPDIEGELRILVFGGSQGATVFSRSVPSAVAALPETIRLRLKIVQQAREADLDDVKAGYAGIGVDADIATFFADLPQRMRDAHLVIARSGASTVTELSAIGRPSVLVPLPIAMDDHQAGNARALSDVGAAIMLREGPGFDAGLASALGKLLANPAELALMAGKAQGRVKSGAAAALADLVDRLLAERNRREEAA
ncbi:MAG: UDP-N-acetylglucosamine--N-acetylmuramyl-(pentapeptide) pyrophosphoryl-undecaprenol N-acetylglucosamine transferase [Alphaproteobacteria bacterium]|nr:UDP-N-acetylglucosamine--N-acetylmuramyl-(pentapeptide) pyrophosphoryl-undecaprenol N-acetylglucosamine transferase [Alphaproteobacteria bacterium]